jgi:hypothetical protein
MDCMIVHRWSQEATTLLPARQAKRNCVSNAASWHSLVLANPGYKSMRRALPAFDIKPVLLAGMLNKSVHQ